ncbi:MAG: LacI family DNA-binding transcriptional regulator, partial [Chloroflexi bacterium]|nr:LacI family DNA-binding transcriptional regulator [Chloroflexota bacterium]
MKDVAQHAGVSIQTVSNVVNSRPIVVEETRQRVLAAMAELGYRPNAIARGLRRNTSQTIGLAVISAERRYLVSAPYLDEVISGVADAARDSDYFLLLHSITPHDHPSALTELFLQRRIDGAILTCAELDEPFVDELNQSGIPFVLIERPVTGP